LPPGSCGAGTVIVSLVSILDATGGLVGSLPLALLVAPGRLPGRHASDPPSARAIVDAALPAICIRAQAVVEQTADLGRDVHRAFLRRSRTRDASLLEGFTRAGTVRVQPGLFDRRILHRISAERALLLGLAQDCRDRLERLDRAGTEGLHVECAVALIGLVSRVPEGSGPRDGSRRRRA
jgi:hypothetical protein